MNLSYENASLYLSLCLHYPVISRQSVTVVHIVVHEPQPLPTLISELNCLYKTTPAGTVDTLRADFFRIAPLRDVQITCCFTIRVIYSRNLSILSATV